MVVCIVVVTAPTPLYRYHPTHGMVQCNPAAMKRGRSNIMSDSPMGRVEDYVLVFRRNTETLWEFALSSCEWLESKEDKFAPRIGDLVINR